MKKPGNVPGLKVSGREIPVAIGKGKAILYKPDNKLNLKLNRLETFGTGVLWYVLYLCMIKIYSNKHENRDKCVKWLYR